jgi:hypothetical protein
MAVHASGIGHGFLPAIGTLHFPGVIKIFEIGTTDETAGRRGWHDMGVLWGARIKILDYQGRNQFFHFLLLKMMKNSLGLDSKYS